MAQGKWRFLLFVLISALFGLTMSGDFLPGSQASSAAPVGREAEVTIVTRSGHPSVGAIQLNRGSTCLVKIGAAESEMRLVLGQPLKSIQNERIYQFKSVQYDWGPGGSYLGVFIDQAGLVSEFEIAYLPEKLTSPE